MDEEADDTLEEGEIVDDDCDYNPLERPVNYSSTIPNMRFPPKIVESESESEQQSSSDSCSDSDNHAPKQKKPKIKPKFNKHSKTFKKENKYNIWSRHIQEEILVATLDTCDVTTKDRSRDVETYDYTLSYSHNNKRTRMDRKNPNIRLKKGNNKVDSGAKGSARIILDLTVTLNDTEEEIAKDMANKLYEEKEDLICKIINVVGKEKALQIFNEVRKIESEGGMLIMNQTRRRTPGGVYIFLIKHDRDITEQQQKTIFEDCEQKFKDERKMLRKKRRQKMKEKIIESRKALPELLTKAELAVQNLTENDRSRKKTEHEDTLNPPPTPETDCHENSCDGIDQPNNVINNLQQDRKGEEYNDDFLDLYVTNMDLF